MNAQKPGANLVLYSVEPVEPFDHEGQTMPPHVTKYDTMPIPPLDAQTEFIDAGAIRFGIEFRLLNDAISAANKLAAARGTDKGTGDLNDRGVSIHIYGTEHGETLEHLRFDCFDEDPHYHYISWRDKSNDMVHLDPVADGDPLQWALGCVRTRLPQMLERAGATKLAAAVDQREIDAALPRVTEAAYRARYQYDDQEVLANALKPG